MGNRGNSNTVTETTQAHCNKCFGERRHEVLHCEQEFWQEEVGPPENPGAFVVDGGYTYEMLKCCGCGHMTVRHKHWFSEDTDPTGEPVVHTVYYPPAISRRPPDWLGEIDNVFSSDTEQLTAELLKEIYVALQNDSRRLAAMGTRALIERIMIDTVGDIGSFSKNLAAFQQSGFISERQKQILETILDAGHAAMHRAYKPSLDDLKTLIDIAESIVEGVYVHTQRASALKKKIPPRKRK